MKPEFSKPFSAADAHAGAPYSCADGTTATILKWDMRGPACPIAGAIDNGQFGEQLVRWTAEGVPCAEHPASKTLVMLPLGVIDGKPVFWDSEIEHEDGTPVAGHVGAFHGLTYYRWPAPAKVYPVTRMTGEDLRSACGDGTWIGKDVITSIANAALRHAVDAGQVVVVDWDAPARAARDMAIASAVRRACQTIASCFNHSGMSTSEALFKTRGEMNSMDLAAIIATIK